MSGPTDVRVFHFEDGSRIFLVFDQHFSRTGECDPPASAVYDLVRALGNPAVLTETSPDFRCRLSRKWTSYINDLACELQRRKHPRWFHVDVRYEEDVFPALAADVNMEVDNDPVALREFLQTHDTTPKLRAFEREIVDFRLRDLGDLSPVFRRELRRELRRWAREWRAEQRKVLRHYGVCARGYLAGRAEDPEIVQYLRICIRRVASAAMDAHVLFLLCYWMDWEAPGDSIVVHCGHGHTETYSEFLRRVMENGVTTKRGAIVRETRAEKRSERCCVLRVTRNTKSRKQQDGCCKRGDGPRRARQACGQARSK